MWTQGLACGMFRTETALRLNNRLVAVDCCKSPENSFYFKPSHAFWVTIYGKRRHFGAPAKLKWCMSWQKWALTARNASGSASGQRSSAALPGHRSVRR